MKLLSADASPFARKVRVLLHEANLTDDVEVIAAATTPLNTDPNVAAANPMGKIPTLIRSDAPALYDSRVITRFLDDHAVSGLYPANRLWDTLTLEATADGIMDAAVTMTYEKRLRPPGASIRRLAGCAVEKGRRCRRSRQRTMDEPPVRPAGHEPYRHRLCAGLSGFPPWGPGMAQGQ